MSDTLILAIGIVAVVFVFGIAMAVIHQHHEDQRNIADRDMYSFKQEIRDRCYRMERRIDACEVLCAAEVTEETSEAVIESRQIIAELQKECEEIASL